MNYTVTHKKLIASVLLALYSFFCLPASAWHSHTKTGAGPVIAADKAKGNTLLKAINENSDGICKVCAHHYSLYCNDAFVPATSGLVFLKAEKLYQHKFLPAIPVFRFLNRGPPAFS